LPATIPSTLVALSAYRRQDLVDREVVAWSVVCGIPATVAGAVLTRWVGGPFLVRLTDVVIAALGVRFLLAPKTVEVVRRPRFYGARLVAVSVVTGLAAGLLANSGGFLLAPLYLAVLRRPIKVAFACSLAVAAVLAVPGTIVHWALGHIDWTLVAVFGATSIPLSYMGARLAVRSNPARLERIYGAVLALLGVGFLVFAR